MINQKQKSGWGGLIAIIFMVCAVGASVYFGFFSKKSATTNPPAANNQTADEQTADTNFEKIGNISQAEPEANPDAWYLVYEEPGGPALSTELTFDDESICSYGWDGVISCAELDFDEGEQIKVKGTLAQGVVLVKILTAYVTKGVPWEEAVQWVKDCRAVKVSQTPARAVTVRLQNDTEIWTEEPKLDDVIKAATAAEATCGKIPMATE